MKKKICVIGNQSSNHVKRWLKEFSDRGYYMNCISPQVEKNLFLKILSVNKNIKKIQPDIVHSHSIGDYGFLSAVTKNHPFILSCWGSDVKPNTLIRKIKTIYAIKKADIVHVQEPLMAERVKELYPHEKIFIQAWGVNFDVFSQKNRDKKWIFDKPTVLCIRKARPDYDISTLLNAIPLILRKIDVKFILRSADAETIKKVPKENLFVFEELDQDRYKKAIASCTLFVDTFHPPDGLGGHGYGQGLLEVMASETPTLIAERPLLKIKPQWYFGDTFKSGNHIDLAKKIIELINNRSRQSEIVRKNKDSIRSFFDWKKNMEIIEKELYTNW